MIKIGKVELLKTKRRKRFKLDKAKNIKVKSVINLIIFKSLIL